MPRLCAAFVLAIAAFFTTAAQADDVADFYKGKRVTLLVSYGPGGGCDVYARVSRPISATTSPAILGSSVQEQYRAPSWLHSTNYLYDVAPQDGTMFGTFARDIADTRPR